MKSILTVVIALVLFASCHKDLSEKNEALNGEAVSSDALLPMP